MTRRVFLPAAAIIALFICITQAAASARAAPGDSKTLAKKHFNKGELYYQQGDFRKALVHYKKAQSYRRHPAFIFNIAQCHRQLRQYKKALFFYRLFLSEQPNASNRKEVRTRIRQMERKVAELRRWKRMTGRLSVITVPKGAAVRVDKFSGPAAAWTPAILKLRAGQHLVMIQKRGYRTEHRTVKIRAGRIVLLRVELRRKKGPHPPGRDPGTVTGPPRPPHPPRPPTPRPDVDAKKKYRAKTGYRPFYKRWWFWTGTGVAVVAGAFAAVMGTFALKDNKKWMEDGHQADRDQAKKNALAADVLIAGAAAAAVAVTIGAIIVWRRGKKKEKSTAVLTPACGPTGCGLVVHGRF
jgi:hypothetical protein